MDLETGLVVRDEVVEASSGSREGLPKSVSGGVNTDQVADESTFEARGEPVQVFDDGFRLLGTLTEAEAVVGHEILRPQWLPEGFALTQIAVAERVGESEIVSNTVVLTYRRWAWRLDVIMSEIPPGEDLSERSDPLDPQDLVAPSAIVEGFEIVPADGLLPKTPAHAWGVIGDQLITVSGGVGPDALATIVSSLG